MTASSHCRVRRSSTLCHAPHPYEDHSQPTADATHCPTHRSITILAIGELPGRLDHDIRPEISPRQHRRVTLCKHPYLLATHSDARVGGLDVLLRERPVVGVVLEQVRYRVWVDEVVDRDPLHVR